MKAFHIVSVMESHFLKYDEKKRVLQANVQKKKELPCVSWLISHIIFLDWMRNVCWLLPANSYWCWTYECYSDVLGCWWNWTWKKMRRFKFLSITKKGFRGTWWTIEWGRAVNKRILFHCVKFHKKFHLKFFLLKMNSRFFY